MPLQGRKRRFLPSTSSEDYDPDSDLCTIEFFQAAQDPYRVAPGNKIPVPWPFDTRPGSDDAQQIVDGLKANYEEVLRAYGIKLRRARVQLLLPRYFSFPQPRETLVLWTLDVEPQQWKAAATDIQEIVDRAIVSATLRLDIRVEIRNESRMYCDNSSIVRPNTNELTACQQVEKIVLQQVQRSCPNQWTSISYHMRGKSLEEYGDRKLTVMVSIAPRTRSFWPIVLNEVTAALNLASSLDVDLHVELLPGRSQLARSISEGIRPAEPQAQFELPEIPKNGASIGVRGIREGCGSLGVWVFFQAEGTAHKQRCFLTCYHVVSPADPVTRTINDKYGTDNDKYGTDNDKYGADNDKYGTDNDKYGISLNGRKIETPIVMSYPSLFDAGATKEYFRAKITQGDDHDGEAARALKMIDKKLAKGIGSVIHTSGYARINNRGHRMDWALVAVTDPRCFRKNEPPSADLYPSPMRQSRGTVYDDVSGEVVSRHGALAKGDWAIKTGRSTLTTVGSVNAMQTEINWPDGTLTHEVELLNFYGGTFMAKPGDSGSIVLNIQKEWVGMVFAVDGRHAFVTPAQDIIDDIKARTGGTITLA